MIFLESERKSLPFAGGTVTTLRIKSLNKTSAKFKLPPSPALS